MEGALDWIVVKVVVRERSEWLGDEKVLPPPIVLLCPVSALERPERIVSLLVATVGAVDLLLFARRRWLPEPASSTEVKLSLERGVTGLEKERCPLPLALKWPDSG